MKYLKEFETTAQYEAYIASPSAALPNVSLVTETNTVEYNPDSVKPITDAVITCDSAMYNGQTQIATNIVVTLSGETLVSGTDYTVSNNDGGINAGDYTFTVNGIGKYSDTKNGTFTIGKAQGSVTTAPTAITGLTPTSSAQALVNAGSGTSTMMYNLNGGAWSSSIPTATNVGSYTVGYKAAESANYTESTTSSVSVTIDYPYVDLGLSVKWCTHNVGAEYEYENGSYFSWANTIAHPKGGGYDFSQATYNSTTGNSLQTNIDATSGYDMARANMGGSWRLPTKEEFQELYDNCTWTWTTSNGVNGYRITSKVAGYTSNSIFIPAVGLYYGTEFYNEGSGGRYWSSSFYSATDAYRLRFDSSGVNPQSHDGRFYGFSVRAVQ